MTTPAAAPDDPKPDLSAPGVWQKLPNESVAAYGAFTLFLQFGDDATLQQVADKTGRSYGSVAMLSSRYLWVERAQAWRAHLTNMSLAGMEQKAVENRQVRNLRDSVIREKQWRRSQRIAEVCDRELDKLTAEGSDPLPPYVVMALLRWSDQSARQATAADPSQDENPLDRNSDPLVRGLREYAAKAAAAAKPQTTTPETQPPTEPPAP